MRSLKGKRNKRNGSCIWCGKLKPIGKHFFYCSDACRKAAFDQRNVNIVKNYERERNR